MSDHALSGALPYPEFGKIHFDEYKEAKVDDKVFINGSPVYMTIQMIQKFDNETVFTFVNVDFGIRAVVSFDADGYMNDCVWSTVTFP